MPDPGGGGRAVEREFDLEPSDNERLASLCGPLDENLRLIESRLGVQLRRRGSTFRVAGAQASAAENLLRELLHMARSSEITPDIVHLALRDHQGAAPAPSVVAAAGGAPVEQGSPDEAGIRVLRGVIRARGPNPRG